MSVVYRVSDRIEVQVEKLKFKISPLDYKVKADMQSSVISGKPMDAAVTALRNSVKEVSGLKLADGSAYELEFEDNGQLTDECVNDLLNIPEASKLNIVAIGLVNGFPQGEFMDPETGKPMEGVKFVKKATSRKK